MADITEHIGYTGKIGREDIQFGKGDETFSVPTSSGGLVTLTKLPSLDADTYSIVKGRYLPKASGITDHGASSGADYLAGNIRSVIDDIGGANATVGIAGDMPVLTNLSIPSNVKLEFIFSGKLSGTATVSFDNTSQIASGVSHQIFGDSLGVSFDNTPDPLIPNWFGDVSGDIGAIVNRVIASLPTSGGVIQFLEGAYSASTPIRPQKLSTDGDASPLTIKGVKTFLPLGAGGGAGDKGRVVITSTIAGPLLDWVTDFDSTANAQVIFEDISFYGPGIGIAGSTGLHTYNLLHCEIKRCGFRAFDVGCKIEGSMYYSAIIDCKFTSNNTGLETTTLLNGAKIDGNRFGNNTNYGQYSRYAGNTVTVTRNYYESNGTVGLHLHAFTDAFIASNYFEGNGTKNIELIASAGYGSVATLISNKTTSSDTAYSLYLNSVMVIAYGNRFDAALSGVTVYDNDRGTFGSIYHNNVYKGSSLFSNALITDRKNVQDAKNANVTHCQDPLRYSPIIPKGFVMLNNLNGSYSSRLLGWMAKEGGAGESVTALSGVTAATTSGSPNVTLTGAGNDIHVGCYISVAGCTFDGDSYAKIIYLSLSGSAVMDKDADATVSGAAVSWKTAESEPIYSPYACTFTLEIPSGAYAQIPDIRIYNYLEIMAIHAIGGATAATITTAFFELDDISTDSGSPSQIATVDGTTMSIYIASNILRVRLGSGTGTYYFRFNCL